MSEWCCSPPSQIAYLQIAYFIQEWATDHGSLQLVGPNDAHRAPGRGRADRPGAGAGGMHAEAEGSGDGRTENWSYT